MLSPPSSSWKGVWGEGDADCSWTQACVWRVGEQDLVWPSKLETAPVGGHQQRHLPYLSQVDEEEEVKHTHRWGEWQTSACGRYRFRVCQTCTAYPQEEPTDAEQALWVAALGALLMEMQDTRELWSAEEYDRWAFLLRWGSSLLEGE